MLRKLICIAVLMPSLCLAQDFIRNNSAASTVGGANGTVSFASVDGNGKLFMTSATGASDIAKAEDGAVASGDVGVAPLFMAQTTLSSTTGTGQYGSGKITTDGALYVRMQQSTTSNETLQTATSAATTNSTLIKGSAGVVTGWALYNTSAAVKYVRLYNLASAPTCGSSTPLIRIVLAANGGNAEFYDPAGIAFGTGIGFCITGGAADSDATAVAANDVFLNVTYK